MSIQDEKGGNHIKRKENSLPGERKSTDRSPETRAGKADVRNWKKAYVERRDSGLR